MNETMCMVKGTHDGNWGNICVLGVVDLYQLLPIGQYLVYMAPQTVTLLSDMAPNGWEDMYLHELTQIIRQRDMVFVECLNNIHKVVPEKGSAEDILLRICELQVTETDNIYPHNAVHVYTWNKYSD